MSWLNNFNNNSNFNAEDRNVDSYSSAVRGVRLDSVAKGDEPQKNGVAPQKTKPDYKGAARLLLADPKKTFKI